ncbi:Transcriptional regulator [Methylorubrum populi]
MTAPSKIRAAQAAPDRATRIRLMADTMRRHEAGPEGACTFSHLAAAGFTQAEIEAYRDDARAILSDRPSVRLAAPAGRQQGKALVRAAIAIRRRKAAEAKQAARH